MKPTRLSKGWDPTTIGLLWMLVLAFFMVGMVPEVGADTVSDCQGFDGEDQPADVVDQCLDTEVKSTAEAIQLDVSNIDQESLNKFLKTKTKIITTLVIKNSKEHQNLTMDSLELMERGMIIVNTNIRTISFPTASNPKFLLLNQIRGNRYFDNDVLNAIKGFVVTQRGRGTSDIQKFGECIVDSTNPDLTHCFGVYEDLHLTSATPNPVGIENFQPEWITGCLHIEKGVNVPYAMFDKLIANAADNKQKNHCQVAPVVDACIRESVRQSLSDAFNIPMPASTSTSYCKLTCKMSDLEVGQTQCAVLIGQIEITDSTSFDKMLLLGTVETIKGNLIIKDTSDSDIEYFDGLKEIIADQGPALQVINNTQLATFKLANIATVKSNDANAPFWVEVKGNGNYTMDLSLYTELSRITGNKSSVDKHVSDSGLNIRPPNTQEASSSEGGLSTVPIIFICLGSVAGFGIIAAIVAAVVVKRRKWKKKKATKQKKQEYKMCPNEGREAFQQKQMMTFFRSMLNTAALASREFAYKGLSIMKLEVEEPEASKEKQEAAKKTEKEVVIEKNYKILKEQFTQYTAAKPMTWTADVDKANVNGAITTILTASGNEETIQICAIGSANFNPFVEHPDYDFSQDDEHVEEDFPFPHPHLHDALVDIKLFKVKSKKGDKKYDVYLHNYMMPSNHKLFTGSEFNEQGALASFFEWARLNKAFFICERLEHAFLAQLLRFAMFFIFDHSTIAQDEGNLIEKITAIALGSLGIKRMSLPDAIHVFILQMILYCAPTAHYLQEKVNVYKNFRVSSYAGDPNPGKPSYTETDIAVSDLKTRLKNLRTILEDHYNSKKAVIDWAKALPKEVQYMKDNDKTEDTSIANYDKDKYMEALTTDNPKPKLNSKEKIMPTSKESASSGKHSNASAI